jgi:hypothetical protein
MARTGSVLLRLTVLCSACTPALAYAPARWVVDVQTGRDEKNPMRVRTRTCMMFLAGSGCQLKRVTHNSVPVTKQLILSTTAPAQPRHSTISPVSWRCTPLGPRRTRLLPSRRCVCNTTMHRSTMPEPRRAASS